MGADGPRPSSDAEKTAPHPPFSLIAGLRAGSFLTPRRTPLLSVLKGGRS